MSSYKVDNNDSLCTALSSSGSVLQIICGTWTDCSKSDDWIQNFWTESHSRLAENTVCVDNLMCGQQLCKSEKCTIKNVYVLRLDAVLAGLVQREFQRSERFRKGLLSYASAHGEQCRSKEIVPSYFLSSSENTEASLAESRLQLLMIRLQPPQKHVLDYSWNWRVIDLCWRRMQLEDSMNWLNTLGGGYSALGDYFTHHAVHAGNISQTQLRVALTLGDIPMMLRCHLYFALSSMQLGNLSRAKRIIQRTYKECGQLPVRDHRLEAMCHGIWNRLRYMYHNRYNQLQKANL